MPQMTEPTVVHTTECQQNSKQENQAFPIGKMAQQLPRIPLGNYPTPVEPLMRLSTRLNAELWVKRDDQTNAVYGSSHLRKIELLLADAQQRGARSILTFGGVGSNWVVAWAAHARQVDISIHAIVVDQPLTAQVRNNLLLAQHFGATLHYARTFAGAGVLFSRLFSQLLLSERRVPYVIRPGGSTPLGCLGSALSGLELAKQIRSAACPLPHQLFITSSTSGTLAGLLAGLAVAEMPIPIVGVRVAEKVFTNYRKIRRLATQTLEMLKRTSPQLKIKAAYTLPPFEICDEYFFREYGEPVLKAEEAVDIAREEAGLTLEGTYTGRTFAAFLAWAGRQENKGRTAMFWNSYSGVDYTSIIRDCDWRSLSPRMWKYFDGSISLKDQQVRK